jgi:hypothetical protein
VKRSTLTILGLSVALLVSNAWWFFKMLDAGITATYQGVSLEDTSEALAQSLAVIRAAVRPDATRAQIIAAATKAAKHPESFEKHGFLWIGQLGLKFNDSGRLQSVATSGEPSQ